LRSESPRQAHKPSLWQQEITEIIPVPTPLLLIRATYMQTMQLVTNLGAGCFQAIKTSAGIKTATFQPERVCISELF